MINVKSIRNGFDGKKCIVHARMAVHGDFFLMTAQYLDVTGSDLFDTLLVNSSSDGGKTWTGFHPDPVFAPQNKKYINVCCDMTPMYHKATSRFVVTGHNGKYEYGGNVSVASADERTEIPYAVFDGTHFGNVKYITLPEKYFYCGSGCSQCFEDKDGTVLMPIVYRSEQDGKLEDKSAVSVLRLAFDGETFSIIGIGNDIRYETEVRGLGEGSVIRFNGRHLLTLRGDTHGYISVSDDGLHYSEPKIWTWNNGETVPTYNTQSHWMSFNNRLYLVYTRKNGTNDHVFRHRAPLYMAEVDTDTLTLIPETEKTVIPERGARLGNFGVCSLSDRAYVSAAEWMQPAGCEKYGSDNSVFVAEIAE